MNILGLDYGHKRIGLSYADSSIGVAVPIAAANEASVQARLEHIANEIKMRSIDKLVVGYPLNMDGSISEKAKEVDEFITLLSEQFAIDVVKVDERLSSYQAESDMMTFSRKKSKSIAARKKTRKTGEVDSRASALFLQEFLDTGETL